MDCTAIAGPTEATTFSGVPLEDWSALVMELTDVHGMSQRQIAGYCVCGQSAISELARGETKDPRHRIGEALRALRVLKRREASEKAVPPVPPANDAACEAGAVLAPG